MPRPKKIFGSEKKCTKCGETKPNEKFYKNVMNNVIYRRASCISCTLVEKKEYYKKNAQSIKIRAAMRAIKRAS